MSSFGAVYLQCTFIMLLSLASAYDAQFYDITLSDKCDSDCVVSCFQNQKVWQNKCLLICGCESTPPSKSDQVTDLPSQTADQSTDLLIENEYLNASDCDSECFTLCAIYNSGRSADYSDCWALCSCQQSVGFLGKDEKVEEDGLDVGLIAGIIWLAFLAIAFIAWCRCDSRSPQDLSQDLELLLKQRQELMLNQSKYSFSIPGTSADVTPKMQRRNTISLPHISGHDLRRNANSISIE